MRRVESSSITRQRIWQWLRRTVRRLSGRREQGQRIDLACRTLRLGTEYGGWTICPDPLGPNSVVYSLGIGEDASFDRALIDEFGAHVFAFDPTPRSIAWVHSQSWPVNFHFYPYGVAAHDGYAKFYPPADPLHVSHSLLQRPMTSPPPITVEMKSLSTLVTLLGHDHIDLLKMDIEGAEYEVIEHMLNADSVSVRQLVVEFHDGLPTIARNQSTQTIQRLRRAGFRLFAVSPTGHEYSFLRP